MLRVIGHSAFAAIAACGLVFAAPLAAEARDDHRGRHGHKSHGQHHGRGHHDGGGHHARHQYRDEHGPHHSYAPYRSRYDYGHSYAPRYRRSVVVHSPFYCGPCGRGFSHRSGFHSHLSGHHGIAAHALSSVIVQTVRGLFYYGY